MSLQSGSDVCESPRPFSSSRDISFPKAVSCIPLLFSEANLGGHRWSNSTAVKALRTSKSRLHFPPAQQVLKQQQQKPSKLSIAQEVISPQIGKNSDNFKLENVQFIC